MKRLTTISLIIFSVILVAIFSASLVFPINSDKTVNVNNNVSKKIGINSQTINSTKTTTTAKKVVTINTITLNMAEIAKHNTSSDCWMLISGKVYDITSYFGYHPGGNGTMAATCGTDATDAYMTKDPYATSTGGYSAHSSRAKNLLNDYFIGNFNAKISN